MIVTGLLQNSALVLKIEQAMVLVLVYVAYLIIKLAKKSAQCFSTTSFIDKTMFLYSKTQLLFVLHAH